MEPAIMYHRPAEVRAKLASLGVTLELLLQVTDAGAAGYNSCTDNDPPAARGWGIFGAGARVGRARYSCLLDGSATIPAISRPS